MIIYKLTSPSNKSYIGQTQRSFDQRLKEHSTSNTGSTIYKAFQKYPNLEDWTFEILCECETIEELNERECYYIDLYDTYRNGYNNSLGGDGFHREFNTPEHNQSISESRKAFFQTEEGEEWKKILSEKFKADNPYIKGSIPWNKGLAGDDYMTSEQRQRRSEVCKAVWTEEKRAARGQKTKKMWEDGVYDNRPSPTEESIQKRINTNKANGFKQTDHQKLIVTEVNKSSYIIHWLDGTSVHITGLKDYARDSGIPFNTLTWCGNTGKGSPKWGIVKLEVVSSLRNRKNTK